MRPATMSLRAGLLLACLVLPSAHGQSADDGFLSDGAVRTGEISEDEQHEFRYGVDINSFAADPFDLLITLDVLEGDCDLVVKGPNRMLMYSEHPSGADILYVSREKIQKFCTGLELCMLQIIVVGYSPVAEYELLFDIESDVRQIHPDDQESLEAIYQFCCRDAGSCTSWDKAVKASGVNKASNFCYMDGQICDVNGRVTHLDLSNSGMQCELPGEHFSKLSMLQRLFLFDNSISGSFGGVQKMLKGMRHLQHLHMSQNELGGNLSCCPADEPDCLDRLKTLDLKDNALSGHLPKCLLELPEIGILDFRRNSLSGDFPPTIPHNPYMMVLDVRQQSGSGMVGKLPDFSPLENLALLGLSSNNFFGEFPALPCKLEAVHLADNQISGSIHKSVSCLNKVWIFDVGSNQLTGQFPDSLAHQSYLQILNVSFNGLSGEIPQAWESFNVKMLSLNSNEFTGSLPEVLGGLNRLAVLNVSSNHLSGALDNFADALSFNSFVQLDLSHNLITGSIPDSLSRLAALDMFVFNGPDRALDASFNLLDGDIPQSILNKTQKLLDSSLHIKLNLQGNAVNCPDAKIASMLRAKLPELTTWTCKDADTLRTVDGSPIPAEVSQQMALVKEEKKAADKAAAWPGQGQEQITEHTRTDGSTGPSASQDHMDDVTKGSTEHEDAPVASGSSSTGAIVGGVLGAVAAMGVAAVLAVKFGKPWLEQRSTKRLPEYLNLVDEEQGGNDNSNIPFLEADPLPEAAPAPTNEST